MAPLLLFFLALKRGGNMEHLKSNRDFGKVYVKGKYVAERLVVVHYLPNRLEYSRIGFSVSKKIGKSVQRNLIKRRLREILRKLYPQIKPGFDIIISARNGTESALFENLEKSTRQALFRAFLLIKEDREQKRGK